MDNTLIIPQKAFMGLDASMTFQNNEGLLGLFSDKALFGWLVVSQACSGGPIPRQAAARRGGLKGDTMIRFFHGCLSPCVSREMSEGDAWQNMVFQGFFTTSVGQARV
jgi:hypothetical protein